MRQRSFGDTDLTASEVAFGTWALGSTWWGETDDPDRLIGRALELGITFFDTGDVYGQGENERIVGKALAQAERDSIQISTKFGYVLDSGRQEHAEGERPHDWSPQHTRRALEDSLSRLGTDYVDLYQLHNARMDAVDSDELFAELDALRDEGKIRHYGVALGPAIGWREEGLHALETRDIAALQTVYNLLEQEPGSDFLAAAERTGAGIMARVPTSSGLLEDKYTLDTEFGPGDHRRHRPRQWLVDGLKKIEQLRFLVIEGERSMTQAALKFILAQPRMATVIPTIGTLAELEEFACAAYAPDLTGDELARVQELYARNFDVEPAPA
ncbi:MAG TPA: aldo/keto reductase [Thermoleophilaceae bacterium]|jgi:aryl-alcohol dehydrogenase-like predicted oxidoreductase